MSTSRVAVVLVAALAILTTTAAAGSAGGTGRLVGAEPAGPSTTVTLITGDRAVVSVGANGQSSAGLESDTGYSTFTRNGDVYVYPDTAVDALRDGRVDEELFNVTALVEAGYDDAHRDTIPLIAEYAGGAAAPRTVTPGVTQTRALPSVDGGAIEASKDDADRFWSAFTAGGIEKLWLDAPVRAMLDESVPQIGAPTAWAAGYDGTGVKVAVLDSGIDHNHPDVAGQVVGAMNFTTATGGTQDGHGHGTHVASTIAGTGARSGGERKGVAPGADLLIGRLFNSSGSAQTSWIIAGMEWAVAQGADVVNMSLGSQAPTDCTDPIAQAAEELADDALFVVAAGNLSFRETVSSPACAAGVLTVGAVDRDLATASFSSRGPTLGGEHRLKPDLAAPGVGIMAAFAGQPGDTPYRAMSGTSMAAPHVAGAAAILTQLHPDWSAQQRKAALISSVRPNASGTVYEQGAGVVDLPSLLDQTLLGPVTTNLGVIEWPHQNQTDVTRDLTYTNTGDAAVTLRLTLDEVIGQDGRKAPGALLKLETDKLTVPAHGTATAQITVKPKIPVPDGEYGEFGARVVASTADGTSVTTPVGFWLAPETVALTVKVLDRRGAPATGRSFLDIVNLDIDVGTRQFLSGTDVTYDLRTGTYSVASMIATTDEGTTGSAAPIQSVTFAGEPELQVTSDTTLVLDARDGSPYRVRGARELEVRAGAVAYGRTWNEMAVNGSFSTNELVDEYYAVAGGPARRGTFTLDTLWRGYAPALKLRVAGGEAIPAEVTGKSGRLNGTGSAELVDLGVADAGIATRLVQAAGKVALVRVSSTAQIPTVLTAADGKGVKAVMFDRDAPGRLYFNPLFGTVATTPGITVTRATGDAVRALLAAGPVTLSWTAIANSPYVYNLALSSDHKVPEVLSFAAADADLAAVDEQWTAQRESGIFGDQMTAVRPYGPQRVFVGSRQDLFSPQRRTAYFSPGVAWQPMATSAPRFTETLAAVPTTYQAGEQASTSWYKQPVPTGIAINPVDFRPAHMGERQANLTGFAFPYYRDAAGHYTFASDFGDFGLATLFENGTSLGQSPFASGQWVVSTGPADYRLQVMTNKGTAGTIQAPNWRMSTRTISNFEFRSQRPADDDAVEVLPLVIPSYDLTLDEYNLTPAAPGFEITVSGGGQADYDAGRILAAKVWTSLDDGTTWVEAHVQPRGGKYVATVDNSSAAGRNVTLRVELTDEHGAKVTQDVIRAYGVR